MKTEISKSGRAHPFNRWVLSSLGTIAVTISFCILPVATSGQTSTRQLHGNVPAVCASLTPIGALPATNALRLAIGLPLRNQAALSTFLAQLYNPGSPEYRQFLSPGQFTARFGPTAQDYESVKNFAAANGLAVVGTFSNRLVLDVIGTVGNIEKAFKVNMLVFQHPTEARRFYTPDVEPTVDASVPILSIEGLNNFALPHPTCHPRPGGPLIATSNSGSGPSGTYAGYDFRDAYIPGVTLTGSGQAVGLVEFDGYSASDIEAYESEFGLPNVPLDTVLIDGADGGKHGAEDEVSLDIEMAISMAPGLTNVIVYEGPSSVDQSPGWYDLLNAMAEGPAKQLSSSWVAWSPRDSEAEEIFQEMQAQGQSYFQASGDLCAYNANNPYEGEVYDFSGQYQMPFPVDSTNLTSVGGTTLTTSGPEGSWVSETVWNWGDGYGGGGGISSQNTIPEWQNGVSMAGNQGSTTMRNIPDVALTADNVDVYVDGGSENVGGTSCAAPLWAGFTALVNQQSAAFGDPSVGFLNPAIYAIGEGPGYDLAFHDITTGNNTYGGWSPDAFYAETGFDLCTGWGTPASTNLINYLTEGEWTETGSLNDKRFSHTATLLTNGEVLVVGGDNPSLVSGVELYNPATGTWALTGSLNDERAGQTATLLPNGEVLVAGGYNSGYLSSAELYNPATGTWTLTGSMNVAREIATATLLTNGEVLVAGGDGSGGQLSSVELYDPATGTWSLTGSMNDTRTGHTATLLPNGEVLVAGGYNSEDGTSTAEVYNPGTGTWTLTGSMNYGRELATATLLPDGQVLVAAGRGEMGTLSSAELYNPATETWTLTGSMNDSRYNYVATLLPNGQVLVAGGVSFTLGYLSSAELYNPTIGTWTLISPMKYARWLTTATLLFNGQVLVAGGENGSNGVLSDAELYTP